MDEGNDVFDVRKLAVFRIDLEMELRQVLEQFFLALDFNAAVAAQGIGKEGQFTLGRNARVELAQGAGSSVAGIGKGFQFVVAALLVQGFEGRDGHVDFAADFDVRRIAGDMQGYGADGAHVVGDVFADDAVAAGHAADELAFFVDQVDGQAVDFQFHHVFQVFAAQIAADALVEFP